MNTIKQYSLPVISILLTFVGFLKLSSSVPKAQDSTSEYIGSIGGRLDTNTAQTITEGYIVSNILSLFLFLFNLQEIELTKPNL